MIYFIFKLFILEKKNAKEIEIAIKLKYTQSPNLATILKILKKFLLCIAEYIKYKYKIYQIGGSPELNKTVAIDETLILHENNRQIWLVGGIDMTDKTVRMDIIPEINSNNLEIFIKNHVAPGTTITHEGMGWLCIS